MSGSPENATGPPVAAILLAAGRSERMGVFKPLLPFGDQSVIQCCINSLRTGGAGTIVVVVGHRADEIRRHLLAAPVQFAVNSDPQGKMSDSIACGVRALPAPAKATLIAPCDYPAVSAAVVAMLIERWSTAGARIVQPEFEGQGGHPVLIDLSLREHLLSLDSKSGLRGLLQAHRDEAQRLAVASAYVVRDLDTWDDYRILHRDVFGKEPPDFRG